MSKGGAGLSGVSLPTLRGLAHAIDRETLRCPLSPSGMAASGFREESATVMAAMAGLDRAGCLAVLHALIAEREHRPSQHLELVWSGPLAPKAAHRDTAVVMRSLFNRAQSHVLVGGYSFDHGAEILEPLHRAMTEREVEAQLFLDIDGHAPTAAGGPAYAHRKIDEFFRDNWPFGGKRPSVFYDPRTAIPGPPWASLHAKCVVVDGRWSLVTSANFTDRGQTRNIELGVLIDNANFAHQVTAQWQTLVTNQLVVAAGRLHR